MESVKELGQKYGDQKSQKQTNFQSLTVKYYVTAVVCTCTAKLISHHDYVVKIDRYIFSYVK